MYNNRNMVRFTIRKTKRMLDMKKIICKVEYDTDNAELLAKYTCGEFGDPKGYEESLYQTPDGKYFIYANGGADSEYPEESIKRLAVGKVNEWKAERGL